MVLRIVVSGVVVSIIGVLVFGGVVVVVLGIVVSGVVVSIIGVLVSGGVVVVAVVEVEEVEVELPKSESKLLTIQ